jgi:hypothetical protein
MRKTSLVLALLSALGIAGLANAQTIEFGRDGVRVIPPWEQDYRYRDHDFRGISERQAIRIAKRAGVDEVSRVTDTRRSFRIVGRDRRDNRIVVVVSRRTGEILDVDRWRS